MNAVHLVVAFNVFILLTHQGVCGSNDDNKSDESIEQGNESKNQTDAPPEGPPDSHEAMNNRELKPKLTVASSAAARKKRSYEFLMGLVKRNASIEITNDERNVDAVLPSNDAKASELLLELLVKIAENPEQWIKVHELLQKIDKDLMKSKEIVENIKVNQVLNNGSKQEAEVVVGEEKTNGTNINNNEDKTIETTKYPWQLSTKPSKSSYHNFAYHRVTGNPLIHTNFNKNPKAYIAVSVIAPKPMQSGANNEEEIALENELKELKPWTHQQNLKNMEQIRSRWIIQSSSSSSSGSGGTSSSNNKNLLNNAP